MCTVQLMKYIESKNFSKFTIDSSVDDVKNPFGQCSFRVEFSRVIASDDFATLCFLSPNGYIMIGDIDTIDVETSDLTGSVTMKIRTKFSTFFPSRDFTILAS